MSRLLSKTSSLTQGNVNTHIFTEFSNTSTEETQKQVLEAIRNINLNVGEIVVGDITVESSDTITHTKLDTLNSTLTNKTLNKTTSSIDISGQTVAINNTGFNSTNILDTPLITGFATETTSQTINDNVEKIANKKGDIQGNIYYTEGAAVWADSTPIPTVNVLNPNGWLYTNTNAGNAMNLYYFNGVNEIKTLSQVTGQYAIVSNLSTKLNNKLIFAIFTKSATSFFTTRRTHSPVVDVNMIAGGRYLLYWGSVPDNLYPNLPRLNFTNIITTGPANPTEEILAVSLNSSSETPAGDIDISIETLGVVFGLESRDYNLLGSPTEYETLVNINTILNDGIGVTGTVAVNTIEGFALESGGNLASIKTNTDKFKFTGENLKTVISNTSITVETGSNPLDVNITGGTISGADGKAYLYSGDELSSITATTVATKVGIDTNLINSSIDTHCYGSADGTSWHHLLTNTNGKLQTNAGIQDKDGEDITSTLIGVKQSLDVSNNAACLAVSVDTVGELFPLTVRETATQGSLLKTIDCNVSGTPTYLEQESQLGSLITNTTTINTSIGTTNTTLSTINGKLISTLNDGSNVGISVYPIMPKMKTYYMNGNAPTGPAALFGFSDYVDSLSWNFGLANPRSWVIYNGTGSGSALTRTYTYEYVDNTGSSGTNSISVAANATSSILPLQGGGSGTLKIVSINKWSCNPNLTYGNSTYINFRTGVGLNEEAVAGGDGFNTYNGVFTCPNSARAFISHINLSLFGAADTVGLLHWDINGNRTGRYIVANCPISSAFTITAGSQWGSLGGFIEAGESIAFCGQSGNAAITLRFVSATVQVFYY